MLINSLNVLILLVVQKARRASKEKKDMKDLKGFFLWNWKTSLETKERLDQMVKKETVIWKEPRAKEVMKEPKEEKETLEMKDLFDVDVKEIEDWQEIKVYWGQEVVRVQWVLLEWMVYLWVQIWIP